MKVRISLFMNDDDKHVRCTHNVHIVLIIQIANTRINFIYLENVTEGALFNTYYSLGSISSNKNKFRWQKSTIVIVRGEEGGKQFSIKIFNRM